MLSPPTDDQTRHTEISERCDAPSETLENCQSAAPIDSRIEADLVSWRVTAQTLRHGDRCNYPPKPSWQHDIRRLQGPNSDWQADLTSRARVGAAGRRLSCQTGR